MYHESGAHDQIPTCKYAQVSRPDQCLFEESEESSSGRTHATSVAPKCRTYSDIQYVHIGWQVANGQHDDISIINI